MPFAAALSEHPLATQAVGEVVGGVVEALGEAPDLAVLFVGTAHVGAMDDMVAAVRALLHPATLIGCATASVVGNGREVEDGPAVSLWAGRIPSVTPVRLTGETPPPSVGDGALLLLADPFTFPVERFLDDIRSLDAGGLAAGGIVVGGLASAGLRPGANRLVLDDQILTDGAVGALIGGLDVESVVSQGCRPIGDPYTVTRAEGRMIIELAGRPAADRVREVLGRLGPQGLDGGRGLHIGRVLDEHRDRFGPGDFLVRNLLGVDGRTGALAVGDDVEVGSTVQLQLRDAASADEDLRRTLIGRRGDAALLFTCSGRGERLFGAPHHDAGLVQDALGDAAVAGMSCAGEIGPVGGRSFVHGFTASMLLVRDRPAGTAETPE